LLVFRMLIPGLTSGRQVWKPRDSVLNSVR